MDTLSEPVRNRRSRSNTPFLRSHCDHENCGEIHEHPHEHKKKIKKIAIVHTIDEELETNSSNLNSSSTKIVSSSSDKVKEIILPEQIKNLKEQKNLATSTSNVTTTVVKTSSITSNQLNNINNLKQTSNNVNSTILKTKEIDQNEKNKELERSLEHNNSFSLFYDGFDKTSSLSSDNSLEHIAYQEYKDAGEYWNKYPKTDYVYSKLSPHRREIAPGIIAMPNMSRKSLEQHHERVNVMAYNYPHQESYIRKRYESNQLPTAKNINYYDSQDEIDFSEFNRTSKCITKTTQKETIIKRIYQSIVITIYTSLYHLVSLFKSTEKDFYSSGIQQEKGFFGKIISGISNLFFSMFRRLYIMISSILVFDTYLLQSNTKRNKKGFLIFLLVLLPILLLSAFVQFNDDQTGQYLSVSAIFASFSNFLFDYKNVLNNFDFITLNPKSSQTIQSNIKHSLSVDEYNNLLHHIEKHIENILTQVNKEHEKYNFKINDELLSIKITDILNENFVKYRYELTDKDVERIAQIVYLNLLKENDNNNLPSIKLINEHLHIEKFVKENLQANENDLNLKLKNLPMNNIDNILLQLMSSPSLKEFISVQMDDNEKLLKQENLISGILIDLKNIQNKLLEKSNENKNLELIVNDLNINNNNFAERFELYEKENNFKFENLLNDFIKISSLNDNQFKTIDEHIKKVLIEILGYNDQNNSLNNEDIRNWIKNTFIAKEFLETRLNEIKLLMGKNVEEEIKRSAGILMINISEKIKEQVLMSLQTNQDKSRGANLGLLDEIEIMKIVKRVLLVYDADKTGLVDYALESAGGQILSTRCTESYQTKSAQISIFGIPFWYPSNTPRIAISPSVQPGECWAFQGFPGFLVLQLNTHVIVSGFTLEHIPKSLSPNGKIDSAPKIFTVWGLESESDPEPINFGKYEFLENDTNLQYFPVQNMNNVIPYQVIELRIESNHGNDKYTCLYRFRVHGIAK